MKKTIANTTDFINLFKLDLNKEDRSSLDNFFKKKVMQIENNKITYPRIESLKKINNLLDQEITELKKKKKYWQKNKNKIQRDIKISPITMYFKKNFWRHKIKEITNKEYKEDVKETKLTDKILLDPEYKTLFETFLVNPDYRKKLKETIQTSIVYKKNGIGVFSEKKKEFKIKNSELKVLEVEKKILETKKKHKTISKIIQIIKKCS